MGVNYSAEAGYGIRLNIDPKMLTDAKYDEIKKYIWANASKSSHKYYNDVDEMLNEDNFDIDSMSEAFPNLRFLWCGNPYFSNSKVDQWFAVANTTYVNIDDDAGYQDLSQKNQVTPESAKQLELLKPFAADEELPRWYVWFNIS